MYQKVDKIGEMLMRGEEIITKIRQIENSEIEKMDDTIVDILESHECYYLLKLLYEQFDYSEKWGADVYHKAILKEQFTLCKNLFEDLKEYGYAVIKGVHLSNKIYGSPFFRRSCDIDLLVKPTDVIVVKKILYKNGFIQGKLTSSGVRKFERDEKLYYSLYSHQIAQFIRIEKNSICSHISVDINLSIFWGEYEKGSNTEKVLSYSANEILFGVNYKCLSPEMEFIALCLHHYKDMNSVYLLATRGIKLKILCDIYYYIKNIKLDIDLLKKIAKSLDVEKYIYYCLWHTNYVFSSTKIISIMHEFKSLDGENLLNCYGLCEEEKKIWDIEFCQRLFSSDYKKNLFKDKKEIEKIQINQKYS